MNEKKNLFTEIHNLTQLYPEDENWGKLMTNLGNNLLAPSGKTLEEFNQGITETTRKLEENTRKFEEKLKVPENNQKIKQGAQSQPPYSNASIASSQGVFSGGGDSGQFSGGYAGQIQARQDPMPPVQDDGFDVAFFFKI